MTLLKKQGHKIETIVAVGAILTFLAGCNSATRSINIYDLGLEKKLEKDWKGTSVSIFEQRFGKSEQKKNQDGVTQMTWTTSKVHWVPSRLYSKPIGPVVSMNVREPAHYGLAKCEIVISSKNGIISDVTIIEDKRVDNVSLCRSSFSR